MTARYIIRLDDACPTMNRRGWDTVEEILDRYGIQPIVSVIPANRDPKMQIEPPDPIFWKRVRSWQDKGWAIALHGYDHVYTSQDGGIVPIEDRSEFAGVPTEIQREKIRKGYGILTRNRLKPKIWVAPSHSFDKNTLVVLKEETDIAIVSDGIAMFPYEKFGFTWIPQQMWRFRTMPFGVWTICLHPNTISDTQLSSMERFLSKYHVNFVGVNQFGNRMKDRKLLDKAFAVAYWFAYRFRSRKREK